MKYGLKFIEVTVNGLEYFINTNKILYITKKTKESGTTIFLDESGGQSEFEADENYEQVKNLIYWSDE